MGKPGVKYIAVQRLDSMMAIGEKRADAKAAAAARGESLQAFSDGKIRAYETRNEYQRVVMCFLNWCRDTCDLRDHTQIDVHADELASLYLSQRLAKGCYSAWTLKKERSILRLYFQNRKLAESVPLPQRKRKNIKRSRRPAKRDKRINLANWQHIIQFCLASGLRREELRDVYIRDVYIRPGDLHLVVRVRRGKGGKWREVKVFEGREQNVLSQVEDRAPNEHVFTRISGLLDIQSYRRQFAQELYEQLSGKPLPPVEGRLRSADLDRKAALEVSRRLGHNRIDVIFGHYLR
jgi:integrase